MTEHILLGHNPKQATVRGTEHMYTETCYIAYNSMCRCVFAHACIHLCEDACNNTLNVLECAAVSDVVHQTLCNKSKTDLYNTVQGRVGKELLKQDD